MNEKFALFLLIFLLTLSYITSAYSTPNQESLKFLSIVYSPRVEVGQSAIISATLMHEKALIPTVTIYYVYFLNQTVLVGGWRVSQAKLEWTNGEGVSIYKAEIPNPAYAEVIPYNSKVIFYLEAKEPFGETLLTCNDTTRWNPYAQYDKYSYLIIDETPPSILSVETMPETPTELDSVTITARAMDDVSGIAKLELTYWVEGTPFIETMNATNTGFYVAVIPPQSSGTKVSYSVKAIDEAGNEKSTELYSYTVAVSPPIQIQQAKHALTYLTLAAVAIIIMAAIYLWRKGWRFPPKPECEHPKAMTLFMLLTFLIAAIIYYQLSQMGSPLIGLLIAAGAVASWSLLDPRAIAFTSNKLRLDRNPPLTLIVEALIMAFVGAITIIASASLRLHSLNHAYMLSVTVGKYVVGLMAAGLILQAIWPQLKDFKFFIEVEELKE
jgi:hypothetical protein